MRKKQIVVIGSSAEKYGIDEAYLIGKFIAENGYVLISGGRGGIMEAASKGAYENKGIVIGILPSDDMHNANIYCNIVIPTGIGYARNIINILSGDIIIAIGGKSGTLSELAYAWQYNKPIICCTFVPGASQEFPKINIDKGTNIFLADNVEYVYKYIHDISIYSA